MNSKIKRWSAAKKAEIVLALIKGTKNLVDVCRENNLRQSEVEQWKEDFLRGGENHLKARPELGSDREIKELRAKVGELLLELDARKKLAALTEFRKRPS